MWLVGFSTWEALWWTMTEPPKSTSLGRRLTDDVVVATREALFRRFARYYDRIYSYKDTAKEVRFITAQMKRHGVTGKDVLDVACGTGRSAELLTKMGYRIVGIDTSGEMLRIARKKVPKATFLRGDMRTFRLKRRFDAVLCMFTSLSYNTKQSDLVRTLRNFRRHLKDKGIVVFDVPFKKRRGWERLDGDVLDENTAVLYSWRESGHLTLGEFYWIVRRPGRGRHGKGASVILDRHVLRLYRLKEIEEAIETAGLKTKIFWDFSVSGKRGKRPVFVCWRA